VEYLEFKCYHCSHCCFFANYIEFPIIFNEEKRVLENLGKRRNLELKFEEIAKGLWKFVINGFCPFYDIKARRCSVHKHKPLACKMFPLLLNPKSGTIMVSRACEWVVENWDIVISKPVFEVFPQEFKIAIEAYTKFMKYLRK